MVRQPGQAAPAAAVTGASFPDVSALTPEQALSVVNSNQNLYQVLGGLAGSIAQERRLQRQFDAAAASNSKAAEATAKAFEKLRGYDASNILSAPADVLAAANKTSLNTLIQVAAQERLSRVRGSSPAQGKTPEFLLKWQALEEQRKLEGVQNVTDTSMYKALFASKQNQFSEPKAALELEKALLSNPILGLDTTEARKQALDMAKELAKLAGGEAGESTGKKLSVQAWREQQLEGAQLEGVQ